MAPARDWLQDLGFGARRLRRAPGFATAVVLTLGLGIGANTAVFRVLYSVVLRPLPFPEAERLVRVAPEHWFTAQQLDALLPQLTAFEALAPAARGSFTLGGDGPAEEVSLSLVDAGHFDVFRVAPLVGRALTARDSRPGAEPVVVLGHALWQRRFGGRADVVGTQIALSGEGAAQRRVVGVMPPGYQPLPWTSDALVPMLEDPASPEWGDMARYWLLGRLRQDRGIDSARAELTAALARLSDGPAALFARGTPREHGRVQGYLDSWVGPVADRLWLMLAAVGAVLLIACANAANLLLARMLGRGRELAVRSALGAGRARLVRQLLLEAGLLALLAGTLGLAVAELGVRLLAAWLDSALPRAGDLSLDGPVVAFVLGLSLVAGLLFGLAPALVATRDTGAALHESGRSSPGRLHTRRGALLVAVEVALCTVLLASAGLLIKSLWRLSRVDPGFRVESVHSLRLHPPAERYPEEADRQRYYREVLERVAAVPGVESAGAVSILPLSRGVMGVGISPDANPVPTGEKPVSVSYRTVTPGYRTTIGIPLLEGRDLAPSDRADSERVGLVNRALAERLWPGPERGDRRLYWDNGQPWLRVVGIVGDVHQSRLDRPSAPEVYVPYDQEAWVPALSLLVRSRERVETVAAVRAAIHAVDAFVPLSGERTLRQVVAASLASPRLYASLLGAFALLALVLGAFGVFSVTSYVVGLRRHELSVRAALGASSRQLVRHAARAGVVPVVSGLTSGLVGSLAATRLVHGLLFGVAPADPAVLAATALVMLLVGGVAALVPSLRAARVDPVTVLAGPRS